MRVFVVFSLLCCGLFPISLLASSVDKDTSRAEVNCEESVDAADDMNFADNIIECNEEAVILYDRTSRKRFMTRKKIPVKTFEIQQRDGASKEAVAEPVHLPGTRFIIRARYELKAPRLALASLHQQMATYCPLGWSLEREWSSPVATAYYLHYEFTCMKVADEN